MYARAKFRVDPSETDFYLGNINGKFWGFNSEWCFGWWRRQVLRMVAKAGSSEGGEGRCFGWWLGESAAQATSSIRLASTRNCFPSGEVQSQEPSG